MLLKYMDLADIRVLHVGDTAGGQFPDGLPVEIVWDASNRWIVDTEDPKYAEVSPEWWDYLASEEVTQDVTDFHRVPLNKNQKHFGGFPVGTKQATVYEQARVDALLARSEVVAEIDTLILKDQETGSLKKSDLTEVARKAGIDGKGTKEALLDALMDFADNHRREVQGIDTGVGAGTGKGTTVGGSTDGTSGTAAGATV